MTTPTTESLKHIEQLNKLVKEGKLSFYEIDECMKTFSIFDSKLRAKLERYFLLYWTPQYLLDRLEGPDKAYFYRDNIKYYVMYQELLAPEHLSSYAQIKLSFRKLPDLDFGFVLVRSVRVMK